MSAENMLKHHECFNAPYNGIDFMIDSCKIDLIPIAVNSDKLMGLFSDDGNGHRFIAYNQNMIPERILFTKAHELGHFVLGHQLKNELLTDANEKSKDPQEVEANVFASALLMPKASVITVVKKTLADLPIQLNADGIFEYDVQSKECKTCLVSAMKDVFNTSKISIEWRIRDVFVRK